MSILAGGLLGPGLVTGGLSPGPGVVGFSGDDILGAIAAWFRANAAMQLLTSDHRLWHKTSSESTRLPYATVFLARETQETYTTAYSLTRAGVQFNFHASTDAEARSMALAMRSAFKQAPLVVGGSRVMHVLPDWAAMDKSDALGPDGKDVWIAFEVFDIAWTP